MSQFVVSYSYTDPVNGERKQSSRTITADCAFIALQRFADIFDGPGVTPYEVVPA